MELRFRSDIVSVLWLQVSDSDRQLEHLDKELQQLHGRFASATREVGANTVLYNNIIPIKRLNH